MMMMERASDAAEVVTGGGGPRQKIFPGGVGRMGKAFALRKAVAAAMILVCAVGTASALPRGFGGARGRGQSQSEAFCSGEKAGLMLRGAAGNFLVGSLAEALSHGITFPLGTLALASHLEGGIDSLLKVR